MIQIHGTVVNHGTWCIVPRFSTIPLKFVVAFNMYQKYVFVVIFNMYQKYVFVVAFNMYQKYVFSIKYIIR